MKAFIDKKMPDYSYAWSIKSHINEGYSRQYDIDSLMHELIFEVNEFFIFNETFIYYHYSFNIVFIFLYLLFSKRKIQINLIIYCKTGIN